MRYGIYALFVVFLPLCSVFSLTVGVFDIQGDVAGSGAKLADLAQSELQQDKNFSLRDRLAVQNIITQQEKCAAGYKDCPELSGMLKNLDYFVTGEALSLGDQKQIVLRAVSAHDQTIAALAVGNSNSLEKSIEEAARDLTKSLASKTKIDKSASSKWKLAVEPVRAANAAAEKLPELAALDSLLLNVLSKKASFDLIETKSDKIVDAERMLSFSGLASAAMQPIGGGDYTHFVTATIKVQDEVRILSYQVVSKKTGVAVISDILEWTQNDNVNEVLSKVADTVSAELTQVLGALSIQSCVPPQTTISFEFKDSSRAAESIQCKSPLLIEDIPAGEYTLVFKHEDRNTLSKRVTIKPVETVSLGNVVLPDIDMSLFEKASAAESAGNYDAANTLYEQFYTKYPRHRLASYAMYREGYVTQLRLKKVAEGRKILENVIALKPDAETRSEAYIGMALGYKAEGDATKASDIFRMLTQEYAGTTAAEFARECLEGTCNY